MWDLLCVGSADDDMPVVSSLLFLDFRFLIGGAASVPVPSRRALFLWCRRQRVAARLGALRRAMIGGRRCVRIGGMVRVRGGEGA